jgi:uncharacterized membrane protein
MGSLYDWMESTPINAVVMGYRWSWPALETLHFLGLCLLIGAVLIMDLRLIGFQRMIPLRAVHGLMPVALVGFAINLITGLGFLFGDPRLYVINYAFWVKMVLVLLAGLNFLLFLFKVEPRLATLGPHDATPMSAKAVATASLVFWFGVLLYGRLLPYLGTGGG